MPADPTTDGAPLRVRGLRITRPDGGVLVDDVSFDVPAGQAVGLIGESGSGKTLVSRSAVGLLPRGLRATGTVELFGTPADRIGPEDWRRLRGSRVAAVFQDPGSSLDPSYPVGAHFSEVLRHRLGRSRAQARRAALDALDEVRIADAPRVLSLYPRELSGGMAQRVVLALALIERPSLLIADEITTALDVTVAAEVIDLLLELRAAHDMTMVVVSHDLSVVTRLAADLVVLHHGRVVESGPTERVLRAPGTAYLAGLVGEYERLDRRRAAAVGGW